MNAHTKAQTGLPDDPPSDIPQALVLENDPSPLVNAPKVESKDAAGGPHARLSALGRGAHALPHEATTNGVVRNPELAVPSSSTPDATDQDAPPLQSWAESYVPFGSLLQRLAQNTYHDLTETIDKMADMQPLQHQHMHSNGLSVSMPIDTNKSSVEKKLALLDFAQRHKDRYIKTLVLAEWAHGMDEMNRLVELTMWLRQQEDAGSFAADGIVSLKQAMSQAKMPNPNIQGALEILSSGKASWMPTLAYVPPEPLTAKALLKTFTEIEFILFTRLNIHEDVPPQMADFTIANGRATFLVPEEFALDVAAADDDPESPLYFIDLRLLCQPEHIHILDGPLRLHLETHVNQILTTGGLRAVYGFLHEYVLTYLIAQMREEAVELSRGKWHGELNVQLVNRSLILQYWINDGAMKHWVEIGLSSHTLSERGKDRYQPPTRLSCRWFRNGQEVFDHSLDAMLQGRNRLSTGALLEMVIAQHIGGRLIEVSRRLGDWSEGTGALEQRLTLSESKMFQPSLVAHINGPAYAVRLTIEPFTAKYTVSPASMSIPPSGFSSVSQTAQTVRHLVAERYLSLLSQQAQAIGWKIRSAFHDGSAESRAPVGFPRARDFSIDRFGPDYSLRISCDLRSSEWSLIRLKRDGDSSAYVDDLSILSASSTEELPNTADQLLALEQHCAAKLSFSILTAELRAGAIPYEAHAPPKPQGHSLLQQATICNLPARRLLGSMPSAADASPSVEPWCLDVVEIKHVGLSRTEASHPSAVHAVTGVLAAHVRGRLAGLLSRDACRQSGFTISAEGCWRIETKTPLGGAVLPTIVGKFRAIERLLAYTATVSQHGFSIKLATLDRFGFRYGTKPSLFAELCGIANDPSSAACRLRLVVAEDEKASNPHLRVLRQLEAKVNSGTVIGTEPDINAHVRHFDEFCQALRFTLPVMQTLCAVEAKGPEGRVLFNCHSPTSFRLSYRTPLPEYTFAISAKLKDGQCYWLVQERRRRQGLNESVNARLAETWTDRGSGWVGLRNGAAAQTTGIAQLLCRLDEIVRGGIENQSRLQPSGDRTSAQTPIILS